MIQGYKGIELRTEEDQLIEFIASPNQPHTNQYQQWINKSDHFGLFKHIEFREQDVRLWLIDYSTTKDINLKVQIPDVNELTLFYILGDDVGYSIQGLKGIAKSGYFNIVYLPRADIEVKLKKSKKVIILGINVTPEDLNYLGTPPALFPLVKAISDRTAKLLTFRQEEFVILTRLKVIIHKLVYSLESGKISLRYPFRFEFINLIYLSFQLSGLYRLNQEERDITMMKAYIEDHLDSVTIPLLLNRFDYKKESLRLLFIKHTGNNALNYIRKTKLDQAMQLLLDGEEIIKVVGKAVGYKRASSFAYAFKTYHGIWPHEVRAKKKAKR